MGIVVDKANNLIEAIYANMDEGDFVFDKEKLPPHSGSTTHGNFIVGIHIREELQDLEEVVKEVEDDRPAMNDDVILKMVISDLQEHHNFSEKDAKERGPNMAESIVEAMWSEYSHVLTEAANGRF